MANQAEGHTPEEDIRRQVLVDNTAQGIFHYLDEIESEREAYEKRWIWELCQNAVDSVPPGGKVDITIVQNGDLLCFRHNGRFFRPDEVAHLIYHGSTKRELEIGKFGTGFLVTHLLSRKVGVRGIRSDGKTFSFPLDRTGESPRAIEDRMGETWTAYQISLGESLDKPQFSAEFSYTLRGDSLETAREGINALVRAAPYLLAFNQEIGAIEVTVGGDGTRFRLLNDETADGYSVLVVEETHHASLPIIHRLILVGGPDAAAAAEIETVGGTQRIKEVSELPKLFIGFPLVGTQDLPLPMPLNSRVFKPNENRDGIFLGSGDTDNIQKNKAVLEGSVGLFRKLASIPEIVQCENANSLVKLGSPPEMKWLDKAWYSTFLKGLAMSLAGAELFRTESGQRRPIKAGFIPSIEGQDTKQLERLWDLFNKLTNYRTKIPAKALAKEWTQILESWRTLGVEGCDQAELTLESFASDVDAAVSTEGLQKKLVEDSKVMEVLNDYYALLLEAGNESLLNEKRLLPNQNGDFVKKPGLMRDGEIDEELKEIAKLLGDDLRSALLHREVTSAVQGLLTLRDKESALGTVESMTRTSKNSGTMYMEANVKLLSWLIDSNRIQRLEGYPVESCESGEFILLSTKAKEKPLAPVEVWEEGARAFWTLFPAEFVMSKSYTAMNSAEAKFERLASEGFVLTSPLYSDQEKLSKDDFEALLVRGEKLSDNGTHEMTGQIPVSKVAFIRSPEDRAIMATVRKSKDKSQTFLKFLFDYVLPSDKLWYTPAEPLCACGNKHKIWPAVWLAPVKERSWVYLRKDKGERPSAEALAGIIEGDMGLLESSKLEKPTKLLDILGISVSELILYAVSTDDQMKLRLQMATGSLYAVYQNDPDQLAKLAFLAKQDPVAFIDTLEREALVRQQVERNKQVGLEVQDLLQEALARRGLNVVPTGVGSDFSVENDFVENGSETVLAVEQPGKDKLFIEVKSTNQDSVKMTMRQAREAKDSPNSHVLAVVKLTQGNIDAAAVVGAVRLVRGIGSLIKDKVIEADNLEANQLTAETGTDVQVELADGDMRIRIYESLWSKGNTFEEFLDSFS